jgi:flagellar biosynthesis protein FliR
VLDWIWYIAMPMASYLLLLLSGIGVLLRAAPAMHAVAAALILLLVTGIRNAWDLVVWIAEQENLPLSADDIPVRHDDTPAESP